MGFFSRGSSESPDESVPGKLPDPLQPGAPAGVPAPVPAPIEASAVAGAASPTSWAINDAVLPPLSKERVQEALTALEYRSFVDTDGDIGGNWSGRMFYFFQLGEKEEILQIRGQWSRNVAIERLSEFLHLCDEWNRERIWPKTYLRVRDDGTVVVCVEVSTDLEHGVTDDQLQQLLRCGIATGSMFFDDLDARFPDPVTLAP